MIMQTLCMAFHYNSALTFLILEENQQTFFVF